MIRWHGVRGVGRQGDGEGIWRSSRWWWAVRGELESDEEWSEDEEDVVKEAGRTRRFATGVKDGDDDPSRETSVTNEGTMNGERMWAEGSTAVKGLAGGSSKFDVGSIIYPRPDPGFEET